MRSLPPADLTAAALITRSGEAPHGEKVPRVLQVLWNLSQDALKWITGSLLTFIPHPQGSFWALIGLWSVTSDPGPAVVTPGGPSSFWPLLFNLGDPLSLKAILLFLLLLQVFGRQK